MTSQIVPITDGQMSATVTGPLHDGDSATFKTLVAPPPPPGAYEVDYSPAQLTWSGLKAEMAANKGKKIGLGASRPAGWHLTSQITPDPDMTFNILQLAPIVSTVDDPHGFMYLRRPHGTWEMTYGVDGAPNNGWTGPIKLADILGVPNKNNNEQHHGIRQDGGDIHWINPIISGVHGDVLSQRLWAKANGGDDVPPLVHISGGLLTVSQRVPLGIIVCRDGSSVQGVTFDNAGTWAIDLETNASGDKSGSILIDGCTFHRHNVAGNQAWGSGGVVSAIQFAGPTSHGQATISNCRGELLDIVAKNVPDLRLINLFSANKAKLILSNSKVTVRQNVVNIG